MEKITSFTICESIANMGPAPALVAPQTILRPQFIPGSFSFGIAVGISGRRCHVCSDGWFRTSVTLPLCTGH